MARHLVRLDLDDVRREDVVYLSVLQRFVAIYPMSWVRPPDGDRRAGVPGGGRAGHWRGGVSDSWRSSSGSGSSSCPWSRRSSRPTCSGSSCGTSCSTWACPWSGSVFPLLPIFSIAAVLAAGAVFLRMGRRWSWEGLGLGILGWWLAVTAATFALVARRELCVPLALAGDPGRPGRGVPGAPRRDGRRAGIVAGRRPALDHSHDDLARPVRSA